MPNYHRSDPLSINHARRFASRAITGRQHFAFRFDGRSVYVTGPDGSQEAIDKLVSDTDARVDTDDSVHGEQPVVCDDAGC